MSQLNGLITNSPLERELFNGRMYAGTGYHRARRSFAHEAICAMLALGERFYVSLSFGKQSLVVAHMVYQVAPDTPMMFLASSESWMMHDFADVIDRFMARWPVNLTIVQTNNAALDIDAVVADLSRRQPSITWRFKPPGDPAWNWKQSRDYGERDLQEMAPREAFDGWFWGLAKEESVARRRGGKVSPTRPSSATATAITVVAPSPTGRRSTWPPTLPPTTCRCSTPIGNAA